MAAFDNLAARSRANRLGMKNREDEHEAQHNRIITTHAGSLPRPPELLKLIRAKVAGQSPDPKELDGEIAKSIDQCVKRQADIGLDVVSDGEFSKPSFLSYIVERLDGVTPTDEPFGQPWKGSREHNHVVGVLCVGGAGRHRARPGGRDQARGVQRPGQIQGTRQGPG